MEKLLTEVDGHRVYNAGLPKFPRNFARDGIISAMLMKDPDMLREQLSLCGARQGKERNPETGEEPGKIFHEYPGFLDEDGLSTEFNACDTTALYLTGHASYAEMTGDAGFSRESRENITAAVDYIRMHLKSDKLFWEDPGFSGADRFKLKVTYWKDSDLPERRGGIPSYPIVYTLAHVQNVAGMRSAAGLLDSDDLATEAEDMAEATRTLYDHDVGTFYIAVDRLGPIRGVSSDALHGLFYMERDGITRERLRQIEQSSGVLETPIGYRTLSKALSDTMGNGYHARTVWPFEQAMIHYGAAKFGLSRVGRVCERILGVLDTYPEIFIIDGTYTKDGCDPQLWTIAAKKYFDAFEQDLQE